MIEADNKNFFYETKSNTESKLLVKTDIINSTFLTMTCKLFLSLIAIYVKTR